MAAHVEPPLMEKELVDMFMDTLQGLYYDKLVGSVSSGFSNLVTIGERIEADIKSGKLQGASSNTPYNSKRYVPNFSKKKRGRSQCCDLTTKDITTIGDPIRTKARQI